MVFSSASALIPSSFPAPTTKIQTFQFRNPLLVNVQKQHLSITCSTKFPFMENFRDPEKFSVYLNHTKDKIWKSIPESVKQFPWKEAEGKVWESIPESVKQFPWEKAENAALHELMVLWKEIVKWSFLAWFPFSWLSDTLFSISRNKELVIPFGLFVGILMTKYLDEISRDFMIDYQDLDIGWRLVGISCFYVLVKIVATYVLGGNHFFLHVANGGLMQLLWDWKKLLKLDGGKSLVEDATTPMSADK